ncbi:versican core protein-like [Ruditapes philippinarum]|uniref:versican core protein-like n=1 Tax=Ruditapes philippinarum TaxID=129788 RepID=UPI00295BAEBA|nr:versican core protein-like [Ruditapes philippinarum]
MLLFGTTFVIFISLLNIFHEVSALPTFSDVSTPAEISVTTADKHEAVSTSSITLTIQVSDTTSIDTASINITVPDDPCTPNPCQNSGTCSQSGTSYTCTCQSFWIGLNCTKEDRSDETEIPDDIIIAIGFTMLCLILLTSAAIYGFYKYCKPRNRVNPIKGEDMYSKDCRERKGDIEQEISRESQNHKEKDVERKNENKHATKPRNKNSLKNTSSVVSKYQNFIGQIIKKILKKQ